MARNNDRDRGPKRVVRDNRPRGKRRVCIFCQDGTAWVDYKDVSLLRRFLSDRGKIRSSRVTGNCSQHQREVQVAIKTAREVALLPYTQRTLTERAPGRGPRGTGVGEPVAGRSEADAGAPGSLEDLEDFEDLEGFEDNTEADEMLNPVGVASEPAAVRQLQESEV
jgi:small subunit ribosomal protein S18